MQPKDFIDCFLLNLKGIDSPETITDVFAGVALVIHYPNVVCPNLYFPDNQISLLQIYIEHDSSANPIPFSFRIRFVQEANIRKYRGVDPNFKRDPGKHYPIDIEGENHYFFDPSAKTLFDGDQIATAEEIVKSILTQHTISTKLFAGVFLRIRFSLYSTRTKIVRLIVQIIDLILFVLYGYRNSTIKKDAKSFPLTTNVPLAPLTEINLNALEDQTEILGIPVHKWTLTSYSVIHLSAYVAARSAGWHHQTIKDFLDSTLLSAVYVVASLFVYRTLLRRLILIARDKMYKAYERSFLSGFRL